MRRTLRVLSAAVTLVAIAFVLSACSDRTPEDDASASQAALARWSTRMQAALVDREHGSGGTGGVGSGYVVQDDVPAGTWDVLLACDGADGWYFRFDSGADRGETLTRADVPCGVTTRVTVTVPRGGGLAVRAHALGGAPEGVRRGDVPVYWYWYAAVVPQGFEPDSRVYDLG